LLAFAQHSGREVVYTCYDEKQHVFLAQSRQPLHQLGGRPFVLDKPKGFYLFELPLHDGAFVVREITAYEGPSPMSTASFCR